MSHREFLYNYILLVSVVGVHTKHREIFVNLFVRLGILRFRTNYNYV